MLAAVVAAPLLGSGPSCARLSAVDFSRFDPVIDFGVGAVGGEALGRFGDDFGLHGFTSDPKVACAMVFDSPQVHNIDVGWTPDP
jgi:hypothetical protein